MAFQSVPDTAEAVIRVLSNNIITTMTHYARFLGVYQGDDLQDLADAYDSWMATELLPQLASTASYLSTEVRGLDAMNDMVASQNAGQAAGGIVSATSSNNVSLAVKRVSGLTGRSARGRVYMTGSPRSEVSDNSNVWEVDWANAVLDAHNEITNYLTGLSWTEVIVSRYTGGAARPFGVTFNVEEWQLTDVVVDSRRDRLP